MWKGSETGKIAVLVVGTCERFILEPTLRHVVLPAVRSGLRVDYHARLTRTWNQKYFSLSGSPEPRASPWNTLSDSDLSNSIVKSAVRFGATEATVALPEVDEPAPVSDELTKLQRLFGLGRTRYNALRKFLSTETLWNYTRDFAKQEGEAYKYVALLREDLYWYADVDFSRFRDDVAYTGHCRVRSPSLLKDYVLILGGRIASRVLSLYSAFYTLHALDATWIPEHYLRRLMFWRRVPLVQIPWADLPMYYARYIDVFVEGKGLVRDLCLRDMRTVPCNGNGTTATGKPCHYDLRRAQCGPGRLEYLGCLNFVEISWRSHNSHCGMDGYPNDGWCWR